VLIEGRRPLPVKLLLLERHSRRASLNGREVAGSLGRSTRESARVVVRAGLSVSRGSTQNILDQLSR
jgi:hypothetical protein